MNEIKHTATSVTKPTHRYNWVIANAQLGEGGAVPQTVAQFNGDGTIFADWEGLRKMLTFYPIKTEGSTELSVMWLHAIMAMHDGKIADAPREFWVEPEA